MLDSIFLLAYARRLGGRARWVVWWHAFLGLVFGYGLGAAVVLLRDIYVQMTGGMNWLAQLSGRMPVVEESFFYWGYVPYLLAAVCAVVWGAKGLERSEEMRFKAQLALHVLDLQSKLEALKQQKGR